MATTGNDAPRLLRFARAFNDAVDKVMHDDPLFMSGPDKTETLVLVETGIRRMQALKLKVLGSARLGDDVCEDGAHRDTADLMATKTHADRSACVREQKLAEALEERWTTTRHACLAGEISTDHARVIAKVLDDLGELPDVYAEHVDAETLARAEEHLIGLAAAHNPKTLRKLAAHLFEVIAPEAAEEIEAKKLAAMEQRAEQAMGITIRRDAKGIEGLSEVRMLVPDGVADRFSTYLHAFTNPRVTSDGEGFAVRSQSDTHASTTEADGPQPLVPFAHPDGQKIPHRRRLAMAFAQMLETLDPARLPIHGGDATSMFVTIGLEDLRKDLAAADLGLGDDASRITAAQARRLACTANLIPVVLGGKSEILDLGRTQRLFNRAQRKAMALRDQRCRAEGCTVPATWCEAHHFGRPWAAGGETNLDDGKLLCRWHHQRAHDDRYLHTEMPNGDVRFARRT